MSHSIKHDTMREGAAEVRDKLKQDIARWSRFRRGISLKPTMGCTDCDATGHLTCITCDGSGRAKFQMGEEPEPCATCEGKGYVTCVTCGGRRFVPNVHRKKILWLLGIGAVAWAFVLWRLWGGDVLPEQMANIRGGGGASVRAPVPPGATAPPVTRGGQGGRVLTPNPGPPAAYPPPAGSTVR